MLPAFGPCAITGTQNNPDILYTIYNKLLNPVQGLNYKLFKMTLHNFSLVNSIAIIYYF